MEKEWKSGEAIWHMKQAELNALDVAAMNKLNEIVDVARLRQRVAELEEELAHKNGVIECHAIDLRERDSAIKHWSEKSKQLRQRVAELESIVEKSIDDGIDKILAMSDDQITALAAFDGSNPRDKETIAKQCMDIAVANVQINELTAERDALKQQRDYLLAVLEELSLYVAYNGDDWVQKNAKAAIASVKGSAA